MLAKQTLPGEPLDRCGDLVGVEADRLLERLHRAVVVVLRMPQVAACQVGAVRLEVGGVRSRVNDPVTRRELGLHRLDDACRDLVLHGEDVGGVAIEALRSHAKAGRHVGQLHGDTQARAGSADAACSPSREGRRGRVEERRRFALLPDGPR